MFARRMLVAGAVALFGLSATGSAQSTEVTPAPVVTPAVLPTTVAAQAMPVTPETRRRGLLGRRANRTTVTPVSFTAPATMTAPVMMAQSTIPIPMPMPTVTTTEAPKPTVTPKPTTVTPTADVVVPTTTTTTAPVVMAYEPPTTTMASTTSSTSNRLRTRTGLIGRIFRR